jgi:hypothetical protein
MIFYGVAFGIFLFGAMMIGFAHAVSGFVARRITPVGQNRFGEIDRTESNLDLKKEGYSVTADWSPNAIAALKKKHGK